MLRNRALIATLALAATTAIACSAGGKDTAGPGAQGGDTGAKDASKKIVMEVTGPKGADITYGVGGDQSQDNGAKLPWKKEITSKEAITIVSVVAQSKGTGDIACKVTIDGKMVKENKSSGQFAVVTCTADNF